MAGFINLFRIYLAYSMALVSRMTFTLICPGKSNCDSISFNNFSC